MVRTCLYAGYGDCTSPNGLPLSDCRLADSCFLNSRWRFSSASFAFFARISSRRCCIVDSDMVWRRGRASLGFWRFIVDSSRNEASNTPQVNPKTTSHPSHSSAVHAQVCLYCSCRTPEDRAKHRARNTPLAPSPAGRAEILNLDFTPHRHPPIPIRPDTAPATPIRSL